MLNEDIMPFLWIEHENRMSVCLNVGEYLQDVFDTRADEGCEGNGYDWQSLAKVFLEERCPEWLGEIDFDSEASMFCVYSGNRKSLEEFIRHFKHACEDKPLIMDLFSRAELD